MIDSSSNIDEAQGDQADEMMMVNTYALRFIEEIVSELAKDFTSLCAFCYELRKIDVDNMYTRDLLDGQVQPSILVNMIEENQWDGEQFTMKTDYQMLIGGGSAFTLQRDNKGVPVVMSRQTGNDRIKFILTPKGFMIQKKEEIGEFYL